MYIQLNAVVGQKTYLKCPHQKYKMQECKEYYATDIYLPATILMNNQGPPIQCHHYIGSKV